MRLAFQKQSKNTFISMKISSWWKLSALISVVLLVLLINSWVQMSEYEISVTQIASEQEADNFITKNLENQLAQMKLI